MILTTGIIISRFAQFALDLLSTQSNTIKRFTVLLIGVVVTVLMAIFHPTGTITYQYIFDAIINGISAGIIAIGTFHLTDTKPTQQLETPVINEGIPSDYAG